MLTIKSTLPFLLLLCFALNSSAQSETIRLLKDSQKVQLSLYFTPSTLRMFNLQKEESYDKMVRDVEKLVFFVMKPDQFNHKLLFETQQALIEQEGYEEYITWQGPDYQMEILGKEQPNQMVGLTYYQDRFYIFDLKGTIDLLELPKFYEKLQNSDSDELSGFSAIFDLIQEDDNKRIRREKRKKEQEAKEKKEAAAQAQQDSLVTPVSPSDSIN